MHENAEGPLREHHEEVGLEAGPVHLPEAGHPGRDPNSLDVPHHLIAEADTQLLGDRPRISSWRIPRSTASMR